MVWNKGGMAIGLGVWLAMGSMAVPAQQTPTPMKEDSVHVRTWNRFVADLLELHKRLAAGNTLSVTRKPGGYATRRSIGTVLAA